MTSNQYTQNRGQELQELSERRIEQARYGADSLLVAIGEAGAGESWMDALEPVFWQVQFDLIQEVDKPEVQRLGYVFALVAVLRHPEILERTARTLLDVLRASLGRHDPFAGDALDRELHLQSVVTRIDKAMAKYRGPVFSDADRLAALTARQRQHQLDPQELGELRRLEARDGARLLCQAVYDAMGCDSSLEHALHAVGDGLRMANAGDAAGGYALGLRTMLEKPEGLIAAARVLLERLEAQQHEPQQEQACGAS